MSVAKASLYSLRQSARKVRSLLDLVRGKPVDEASAVLAFARKEAAESLRKLLHSAVSNATQKDPSLQPTSLYVSRAFADGASLLNMKKLEPKAMLRHGVMKRRHCHVTIEVDVRPGASPAAPREARGGQPAAAGGKA